MKDRKRKTPTPSRAKNTNPDRPPLQTRRAVLQVGAGGVTLPVLLRFSTARAYPMRPVRIVVPFDAGGGTDILARLVAQWLSDRLGQQFFVENRPGAGSNIGTEAVVRAAPDGHTLLLVGPPAAINATLYSRLNYNFISDIAPVAGLVRLPLVMVLNSSFPAQTIPEFIDHARAHPGMINMASAGNGTAAHLAGEMFKMMTGIAMEHVPYRGGGPALIALMGRQVHVLFGFALGLIEHIRAGRLRALGVTTTMRSEALPDTPSISDRVPGYEAGGWYGLAAPRNTPVAIVNRLSAETNAALADSKIRAQLADLSGTPMQMTAAEFATHVVDETEKWAKVVAFARAKPE